MICFSLCFCHLLLLSRLRLHPLEEAQPLIVENPVGFGMVGDNEDEFELLQFEK